MTETRDGETGGVEAILSALREEAELAVPERLDRKVRRMILERPAPSRPYLAPVAAAGLAMAALLALFGGLAAAVAEGGSGSMGPVWVGMGTIAYLAVCSTLMVPILAKRRPALVLRPQPDEVNG